MMVFEFCYFQKKNKKIKFMKLKKIEIKIEIKKGNKISRKRNKFS